MQQRRAQETAGDRGFIGHQISDGAAADDLAAAHAGAGAEVQHIVRAPDRVLVVLDDDQGYCGGQPVPPASPAAPRCRADAARWLAHRAHSTPPAGSSPAVRRDGCAALHLRRGSARLDPTAGSPAPPGPGSSDGRGSRPADRVRSPVRAPRASAPRRSRSSPRSNLRPGSRWSVCGTAH